jgi:hypothetical protein
MPKQDNDIPGVWRDEQRLPLSDLVPAVATSADDGQTDDLAGNDAGIEEARTEIDSDTTGEGDPDPHSVEGRALRNDFTGPIGPH